LKLLLLVALVGCSTAAAQNNCPPEFVIGQTYNEIKAGPCPDIARQAFMVLDSTRIAYYCPSRNTAVVGSIVTGKMEGFFLSDGASGD
jgi:hypothetical protein